MSISTRITGSTASTRRWLFKPAIALAMLGGVGIAVGAGAAAQGVAGTDGHHGGVHAMRDSSEDVVTHVNGMLQYIYSDVGATAAQKAQLAAIVQKATTDLAPVNEKLDRGHEQVFSLLTRGTIDRTALEAARVEQMSLAEQASKRVTQFVADVAEVLTPAQRKALADHLSQHTS